FDVPGHVRTKDLRKDFFCGLHQALGPACLLRFEAVHVHGKFAGAFDVGEIEKLPALELRTVGEIGVFGEGVMLPAAGGIDCGATPDACRPIEIEKRAAAGAGAMFDAKVAIEQNRFYLCEQGIVAIEVGPACLRHADGRILEVGNGAAQEIGFRDEVGVKDGDEFAAGGFQSIFESAGFVAFAVVAMNIGDGNALGGMAFDAGAGNFAGFVGGVVEDLDVEDLVRVIKTRDGFDKTFDDVAFVKNGKLHGDARPYGGVGRRAGNVFAIFVVVV